MRSSHHAPYVQGYTRATLARTKGCDTARWSESLKARLGSWISTATVNTFPGLVHTARHTTGVSNTRSRWPNPQGREPSTVGLVTGVKS
jgi:hypothetical protein